MDWLVYFGDGSTWNGDPFYPPQRTDVQVISRRTENGGIGLIHGKDYYVWRDSDWVGVDAGGLWDYVMTYLKPQSIILGRTTIRDTDFWNLVSRAKHEGLGQ